MKILQYSPENNDKLFKPKNSAAGANKTWHSKFSFFLIVYIVVYTVGGGGKKDCK